jgi:hypothetical protein
MKIGRTLSAAVLCFLTPGFAAAQDKPLLETYLGYSLLQLSSGAAFSQGVRLIDGGHAAVTLFPSKRVAWMGDFSRNRGTFDLLESYQEQFFAGRDSIESSQWSLTGGPRLRILDSGRFGLWAHGLLGVSRDARYELQGSIIDNEFVFSSPIVRKRFGFTSVVGVSPAVNLTNRLAWRTDVSWVHSRATERGRNRSRFSTGLSFTWGK